MPPRDALAEFANTYQEWHYLVGGAAIGFLAGIEYARRVFTA
jgi:hypothetical protein